MYFYRVNTRNLYPKADKKKWIRDKNTLFIVTKLNIKCLVPSTKRLNSNSQKTNKLFRKIKIKIKKAVLSPPPPPSLFSIHKVEEMFEWTSTTTKSHYAAKLFFFGLEV